MICKKCNSPLDENDKVCSVCGTKVKGNNIIWIVIIGIILIAGIFIVSKLNKESPEDIPEIVDNEEIVEEEKKEEKEEEIKEEVEEVDKYNEIPTSDADLEKPIEEVWVLIDNLVENVNQYYDKYITSVT